MRVAFHCGCGTVIQVDPSTVGRGMRCPVCHRKITRSELQGPRAQPVGASGPQGGPVSGGGGLPGHWSQSPPPPSLPWGWIGAAAGVLVLLLLVLLARSLWQTYGQQLLAQQQPKADAAARSAPERADSPQEKSQPAHSTVERSAGSGQPPAGNLASSRPAATPRPLLEAPTSPDAANGGSPSPAAGSPTPPPKQPSRPATQTPPPPATAPPVAAEPSWHRVVDRQGAFEVMFPRGRVSREQTAGAYGTMHMQLALTRWGEFRVIYTDFPPSVPLRTMNDVLRAFGPMLQELYGQVQGSPRQLRLHGFPGMELRLVKSSKLTVARVFLVRRRVYLVLWTGSQQPRWLDRFFGSFDLPWARR